MKTSFLPLFFINTIRIGFVNSNCYQITKVQKSSSILGIYDIATNKLDRNIDNAHFQ